MFEQRGRRWAQAALAAAVGGLALLGFASPAAADTPVTGVPGSASFSGVTLLLDAKRQSVGGLTLTLQGQAAVPVYCIDFHTPVATKEQYTEGSWGESEVKNLGKVQWVLSHGYPNADATGLLTAAGAASAGLNEGNRDRLLYFGTQTAVWHFSDGVDLGAWQADQRLTTESEYAVIKKVYDYLTANAVAQPEPTAELSITPGTASASVGEKAGPFTVKGPAGEIALTVTGGQAVDAAGKPLTSTTNGAQFWLTAGQEGKVTAKVTAENSVSFGRVFLYSGGKDKHQKLILGTSVGKTVTGAAEATFTPAPVQTTSAPAPGTSSPTPAPTASASPASPAVPGESTGSASPSPTLVNASENLPVTGSATATVIGAGVLLLIAGAGAVLVFRRRRVRFTS
ncbi:thioester domain-containing protein [Actinoplanes siamensis]|uniref:Thioester domain-containing protein n=1 Tax=Actinoplanes siamensis TaxID=1223317 RepID=A0A919NC07_9ACTN|nr:thioester domain-containing protein [Actinoplanes siamensis]GIF08412.1 hypothetical protein Asi03nite_59500 [Actinoplanes siamensis]